MSYECVLARRLSRDNEDLELLSQEHVSFDEVLGNLPRGIHIEWDFRLPTAPETTPARTPESVWKREPKRLYVGDTPHVLLMDGCGNSIWLRPASEQDITPRELHGGYHLANFVGEAVFEKFGLQGRIGHIFDALKEQNLILMLYEVPLDESEGSSLFCRWCEEGKRMISEAEAKETEAKNAENGAASGAPPVDDWVKKLVARRGFPKGRWELPEKNLIVDIVVKPKVQEDVTRDWFVMAASFCGKFASEVPGMVSARESEGFVDVAKIVDEALNVIRMTPIAPEPEPSDQGSRMKYDFDDDENLFESMDGLYAYDTGSVDSGIKDELMKESLKKYLKGMDHKEFNWRMSKFIRKRCVSKKQVQAGYGFEDLVGFIKWLDHEMGISP